MKSEKSCSPCSSKVATKVDHVTPLVPEKEQTLAVEKLGSCPEELTRWLRGHFLSTAVLKYLHTQAKGRDKKNLICRQMRSTLLRWDTLNMCSENRIHIRITTYKLLALRIKLFDAPNSEALRGGSICSKLSLLVNSSI